MVNRDHAPSCRRPRAEQSIDDAPYPVETSMQLDERIAGDMPVEIAGRWTWTGDWARRDGGTVRFACHIGPYCGLTDVLVDVTQFGVESRVVQSGHACLVRHVWCIDHISHRTALMAPAQVVVDAIRDEILDHIATGYSIRMCSTLIGRKAVLRKLVRFARGVIKEKS